MLHDSSDLESFNMYNPQSTYLLLHCIQKHRVLMCLSYDLYLEVICAIYIPVHVLIVRAILYPTSSSCQTSRKSSLNIKLRVHFVQSGMIYSPHLVYGCNNVQSIAKRKQGRESFISYGVFFANLLTNGAGKMERKLVWK